MDKLKVGTSAITKRPKCFRDIIGHEAAKKQLLGALERNKIPAAMLFTGGPGLGKTTFARIVANALNCQERIGAKTCLEFKKTKKICPSCELTLSNNHPDFHELNTANTRKIDNVRSLIEHAGVMPTFNHRVFLIDEIQQFTPDAEQAILKPLEEPPAHTIWLLASMEPHRIHEAVRSRSLIIPLSPFKPKAVSKLIKTAIAKEDVEFGKSLIRWITAVSNGKPRETLQLTEALVNYAAYDKSTKLDEVPTDFAESILDSGILGIGVSALVILTLIYVQAPIVFAYLQKGVTAGLLGELFQLQDSFIAEKAYGRTWRWDSALSAIQKVVKLDVRLRAYSLPMTYHIKLAALLGDAVYKSRTFGDPGIALRHALAKWFEVDIESELLQKTIEEEADE